MALSRWSLHQLVAWIGVVALMALFLPLGLFLGSSLSSSIERNLVEKGGMLAGALGRQSVDGILMDDRLALHDLLEKAAAIDDEIRYICIVGRDGGVIAHTFERSVPAGLKALWRSGDGAVEYFSTGRGPMMDLQVPIVDGQLGEMHVGLSRERAVRTTRRLLVTMGAVLLSALGLVFGGAHLVAARVSGPLSRLEEQVRLFPAPAEGAGGHGVRGTREVESLDRAIGEMEARLNALERERGATQGRMIHAERLAALGELSAGLAHEIHNPLDGMLECVRYLEADGEKSERAAKYLPMLQDGLGRIGVVMRQMLNFARAGNETAIEEVGVSELIQSLGPMYEGRFRKDGVGLSWKVDGVCTCMCNRQGVAQAVLNLALNGAEVAEAGEEPRVAIEATCDRRWVYINVGDSGPGVPEKLREKIFDPFFTTKPTGKGTGLGLSISRQIIRAFGGDLSLQAERSPLGGACFVIRLLKGTCEEDDCGCEQG